MSKKKIQFDWSSLDRHSVAAYIWSIEDTILPYAWTPTQFHKVITGHIKKIFPVRFRKIMDQKLSPGEISIGGMYSGEFDKEHKKCIEITFFYSTNKKKLTFTKKRIFDISMLIADCLLHEIIHMRQYRRRKFKTLPDYASTAEKTEIRQEQTYLGCTDEIDAYGFNIACELIDKFDYKEKQIIAYLNKKQKIRSKKINTWQMYLKAFEHNHNHPIIKRLKKKVVRYLPAAYKGKPYRNKDWIDR